MLGKLIKYEFKATGRIFLPIFGALLVVAVINRIFLSLSFEIPTAIGIAISTIMMIGIAVLTLILTLQRFSKNLLGSEGYLMFTLPVKTSNLIFSKLIVSSVWFIASGIIVSIAILIMAFSGINLHEIIESIRYFFSTFNVDYLHIVLYVIEAIVFMILSLFSTILLLYACMSLSLFFNKHRGLAAFGVFILFNIIGQTIGGILVATGFPDLFVITFESLSDLYQMHFVALLSIITDLITGVIFYLITMYMLKNKLNLE